MALYSFGGRVLNNGDDFIVLNTVPIQPVGPIVTRIPLAFKEGSISVLERFAEQEIIINGVIRGLSKPDVEEKRDLFVRDLLGGTKTLRIGFTDDRYYMARLQETIAQEEITMPHLWFYSARFLCTDPLAYATDAATPISNNAAFTFVSGIEYTKTIAVPVGGTAPNRPIFNLTISTGGIARVWITNSATGDQLSVTRTFTIGEILTVNSELEIAYINGSRIDFEGRFPLLDPRAGTNNNIVIKTFAGLVPTIPTSITYRNRYA